MPQFYIFNFHVDFPTKKCFNPLLTPCRHKTRLHIGQLVKDTSAKLKQASEIDHHAEVNVSYLQKSPH